MDIDRKTWWFVFALKTAELINKEVLLDLLNEQEWLGPVTAIEDSPYGLVARTISAWAEFNDIRPLIWKLQDIFPSMVAVDLLFHKDSKLRSISGDGFRNMFCTDMRIEPFKEPDSAAQHMQQLQIIISTYTGKLKWLPLSLRGRNWKCNQEAMK